MKKEDRQQIIIVNGIDELTEFKKDLSDFKEYMKNYSENILKPELLAAEKAAEYFSVSEATLREHSGTETYRKYKFADRKVYYKPKEIEDYILSSVDENN